MASVTSEAQAFVADVVSSTGAVRGAILVFVPDGAGGGVGVPDGGDGVGAGGGQDGGAGDGILSGIGRPTTTTTHGGLTIPGRTGIKTHLANSSYHPSPRL